MHATAGNISVRTDTGFLITPTDACLGFLDPARLAEVDAQAAADRRCHRASKTIALHAPHLQAADQPETRCVIHTHSTHCVALTLQPGRVGRADDIVPPITPYFVMKVGHVPLIPTTGPATRRWAKKSHAASPLWRSRHADPRRDAGAPGPQRLARLAGRSQRVGPAPLVGPQIDELRRAFGARW